jgi:hypothetical protein
MWILPAVEMPGAPDHVEVYPITRYRVRMEVLCAAPPEERGELRAFSLGDLAAAPIPSPHRRAIEALAAAGAPGHV